MNNHPDFPESDDLNPLFKAPEKPRDLPQDEASKRMRAAAGPGGYAENCLRCGGSGHFVGWSGRVVGPCRACKGSGRKYFKTSPEVRATAKAKKVQQKVDAFKEFVEANPDVVGYLEKKRERWSFAASMLENLSRYGSLTDNQLSAVKRSMERDAERQQQYKVEAQQRVDQAPSIDIAKVLVALNKAVENGLKWPKLRLGTYTFSLAGAKSKNPGAVYVTGPEYYCGKIIDGRFVRSRECTVEQADEIVKLAAEPAQSAVAYGRLTGACACCGRELTNAESVARGIGPICAEKFGF